MGQSKTGKGGGKKPPKVQPMTVNPSKVVQKSREPKGEKRGSGR